MASHALSAAIERSDLVRAALSEARRAHLGQVRNSGGGEAPFIEHPLAVAERLAEREYADEVVAAALLHDVLEHGGARLDELRVRFGDAVAELVEALTEDAAVEPYGRRKDEHRDRVARAGREARAIFAADKLVNVRALRGAYAVGGEAVDRELRVPMDEKLRTWELDLAMLAATEPGLPLAGQLAEELAGLRRERSGAAAPRSG
jgi:(p)ppGpp synthase/HD superfamily hydrolase